MGTQKSIFGIDIGTGASCIYPLLGAALHPNWHFDALEVDKDSIEYAEENVRRNRLEDRIRIIPSNTEGEILPKALLKRNYYDFCVCNPPFYKDQDQMDQQRQAKRHKPMGVCTGSHSELFTKGGELEFCTRLIEESILKGDWIHWFTTLVGRKADALELKQRIDSKSEISDSRMDTFTYGQTTRWILSWRVKGMNAVSKAVETNNGPPSPRKNRCT